MYPETPNVPEVVDVPCATYIMIRGRGAWDGAGSQFAKASHAIRNVHKELSEQDEGFDPSLKHAPLEAFWWQQGALKLDLDDKESFIWVVAMQVGNASNESFCKAQKAVSERKGLDCSNMFLATLVEGKCVQIRHAGSYEHEKDTVALMEDFIEREQLEPNPYGFSPLHEIYLPLKERDKRGQWDTIYRWAVRAK